MKVFESIAKSMELGLCLVSKRSYRQGDIVFEESPLLTAPPRNFSFSPGKEEEFPFNCVTCFRKVTVKMKCDRCGWPCCSSQCSEHENHRMFECSIFKKRKIAVTSTALRSIMVLRFILCKKQNPVAYKKLMKLCSEYVEHNLDFDLEMQNEVRSMSKFLKKKCKLKVKVEEVKLMLAIVNVNCFGTLIVNDEMSEFAGRCLYEVSSLFSHSCCPNLEYSFFGPEEGGISPNIRFHARKAIYKGEMLTIAYVYNELLVGNIPRQQLIWNSRHFICKCSRCLDEKEENSYFSAIPCSKCNKGYLLPGNSAATETKAWRCDSCRNRKSHECMTSLLDKISQRPLTLINMESSTLDSLQFADAFIDKASGSLLHRNHYLVFCCVLHWLRFSDLIPHLLGHPKTAKALFIKIMKRMRPFLPLAEKFLSSDLNMYLNFAVADILAAYFFQPQDLHPASQIHDRDKMRQCKRILCHLKSSRMWLSMAPAYPKWKYIYASLLENGISTWSQKVDLLADQMQENVEESISILFI